VPWAANQNRSAGRLIADLGDLATQDGVPAAQDQKFGILRDIAARDEASPPDQTVKVLVGLLAVDAGLEAV
jgi:hypothetical protein